MALPKAIKNRWVKALRSGKYEQGTYALSEKTNYDTTTLEACEPRWAFCCLGVLRDILTPAEVAKYDVDMSPYCMLLTGNTPAHGGLRSVVISEEDQEMLATKNDTGTSFAQIASYIEKRKTI